MFLDVLVSEIIMLLSHVLPFHHHNDGNCLLCPSSDRRDVQIGYHPLETQRADRLVIGSVPMVELLSHDAENYEFVRLLQYKLLFRYVSINEITKKDSTSNTFYCIVLLNDVPHTLFDAMVTHSKKIIVLQPYYERMPPNVLSLHNIDKISLLHMMHRTDCRITDRDVHLSSAITQYIFL